ncbi:hypothetical protein GCM10022209_00800 [Chitinophaga oryziterrae]
MFQISRYLFCLLLFVTAVARGQQYPVTASTQVIPPYSVYLPDYAVPGSDKLRVILVQNDLTQPSYDVILQMTVEQNGTLIMRTSGAFHPKPLTLMPGVPTIISGADLSDYLSTNNIDFSGGFSRETYDRTKSLPEGAYRISFTAYDYRRQQVQVSNIGANIFFFQKSDPPLLNLPICGSRVEKRDPQFLSFNWSSRNTPNPLPGSGTEYVFSLYEIKPKNSNADYIVRSSTPVYTITTESNTIIYGPGEPQLTDSMQYAWNVRARDKSGRDLFSNQGLSQTCTFTYLGTNPFAVNNIAKPLLYGASNGERSIKLHWPLADKNSSYTVETYRLQYRAAAKDGTEFDWSSEELSDSAFTLNSLEPDRTYESRLQWRIAGVYGPYSEVVKVTTDSLRTFVCGDGDLLKAPENTKPLLLAVPGFIVRIGHFDVLLTEVSGSNGVFTGKGRVITPGFGIGLLMTFSNITINTDLVVIKGEMQAVTSGIDKFVSDAVKSQRGGNDVGQVKTGDIVPDITTKLHIFSKDNIAVDTTSHTITITAPQGGGTEVIDYAKAGKTLPLVLEDADGNLYNVDKNGTVTAAGTRDKTLDAATLASLNNLQLDNGKVIFAAAGKYAFDAWKDAYAGKSVLDSSYELLANGQYRVSAKAILPGVQDIVTATLQNGKDIDVTKVKFASGKGIVYPSKNDGNNFTVTITGGPASDAQEMYALYPKAGGGYISMGKLLIASYAPKQKTLVLIPIGKETAVPVTAIQSSMEKAYANIGVTYTIVKDDGFRENKDWDIDGDGFLQDTKSAFLSNGFTGEEKAMKKAYAKTHTLIDDAVYLFIVNEATLANGDLLGKMPRQSQFGFIFEKGKSDADVALTVAHETGHGQFTLEHTFSNGIGLTQGTTDNLMDYNNGYALLKYQWDVVHDPGHVWGIFESDAESQLTKGLSLYKCLDKEVQTALKGKKIYYSPDGNIVELPDGAVPVSIFYKDLSANPAKTGSLSSYMYNGKEYVAFYNSGTGKFVGYGYDKDQKEAFVVSRTKRTSDVIANIVISTELNACEIKIDGTSYVNYNCLCQNDNYSLNYKKLVHQVIDSDKPEVKAEIESVCKLIATLPDEVLKTNNELFNLYYNNLDLYWYDWNTPSAVISLEKLKVMHQQLIDLDANIKKLKECNFATADEIVEFVNDHFVISGTKMSYLTNAQFKDIAPEKRVCLIEKLVEGDFEQRWTISSSNFGGQNITLEILRNCKNQEEFYKVIKQLDTDGKLYDVLSKTYDYLYVSEGSFTQLTNSITSAFINLEKPAQNKEAIAKLILSKDWLVYDNGYLTARNKEEFKDASRKISFQISDGAGKYMVDMLGAVAPGAQWLFNDFGKATPFSKSYNPLDNLVVIPVRDVTAFGTTLEKGMPYVLPAVSVYQLFKEDTKKAIGTSTEIAVNTALCAVGIGGLSTASSLTIALETVDIGLSTFVTYANSAPEMAQDHPDFVKYTNYLAIAYTVGRLGHSVASAAMAKAPAEMMAARYTDDALEVETRAVMSLGEGDVKMVEGAFANVFDKNMYVVVHGDSKGFSLMHNGAEARIDHRSVARWIEGNTAALADKEIVLLSCGDLKSAQNLCNKLNRPVIANNGWVRVYENGAIETENSLMRLTPNGEAEVYGATIGSGKSTSGKVSVKLESEGSLVDDLFPGISSDDGFSGFKNLYKNNKRVSVELLGKEWPDFVAKVRKDFGIGGKRNFATMKVNDEEVLYLASSSGYNGQMRQSGKFVPESFITDLQSGKRVFKADAVRDLDTEVIGFEYFARKNNAEAGKVYKNVTGEIVVETDLIPCGSCSSVMQQFSEMYPNVLIKIRTNPRINY